MSHPIFSSCGKYRYTLERLLKGDGPKILFVGINPSYATADENDKTVQAWICFANQLNASKFYVANIFNRVTPYVGHLKFDDPFGPDKYKHLNCMIEDVDLIIPCWGDRKKLSSNYWPYFDEMEEFLVRTGKPLKCYGLTKITKDPVHLQRISRSTKIQNF
ncbi:hypothetical protein D9M71_18600 [compost metagenome]